MAGASASVGNRSICTRSGHIADSSDVSKIPAWSGGTEASDRLIDRASTRRLVVPPFQSSATRVDHRELLVGEMTGEQHNQMHPEIGKTL